MASADAELEQQLKEAGKQLSHPPVSVDELISVLDKVEKLLLRVDKSPKKSMIAALIPPMNALIKDSLLKHSDVDVKVAVASCISEITRITAPDAPYDDDQMRVVFELIVSSFEDLADRSSRSYNKRASILKTVSKVGSCVIMLDLECDELIVKMFEQFLKSVRDYHLDSLFSSMENIMVLVIDESVKNSVEMLKPLLASVKKDRKGILPVAHKLGKSVLLKSADRLKPYMMSALTSLGESLDMYDEVVAAVCESTTANFENKDDNDSGLQPVSGIIKCDESLVGTEVKVWWALDQKYYVGVVAVFYPDSKMHKVLYVDGDEEILDLRSEKWKILKKFNVRDDQEQNSEVQTVKGSPDIHKKKKSKTDHAASQETIKDSVKKVGGVSSSGMLKGSTPKDDDTLTQKTSGKLIVNKSKGKTSKSNTNGPTDSEKMECDKEKEEKILTLEDKRLRLEARMLRIKAEKEQSKIRQEDERLRLEAEKVNLSKKESDIRIMMMDVSVMPELQRLYFEKLQREIIVRSSKE